MYKLLNKFLRSDYFDRLPKFLARKIFKIFKIFFVETTLKSLPEINHPPTISYSEQEKIITKKKDKFYRPFSTCLYSLEILTIFKSLKGKIRILDFGANNIDKFVYLDRYLNDWEYIYHDQPSYNNCISTLIQNNNLKNISVTNNLDELNGEIDFVFFGSSIHYINRYKEILDKIFKLKPKYLIFSHTPFYNSDKNDKDIVMKQLNIHPVINYAYLLQYTSFTSLMSKNGYNLISQNKNNFIKFLNFKNFENFSFISFLDLIFINKSN